VNLGIDDFRYSDLYDYEHLRELAAAFDRFLHGRDAQLSERFESYRAAMQGGTAHGGLTEPQEAELLIGVSRHLAVFLTQLFNTDDTPVRTRTERDSQVARFKKEFVLKRVAKVKEIAPVDVDFDLEVDDPEYALAVEVNRLLAAGDNDQLAKLAQWAAAKWKAGAFDGWTSFHLPKPTVYDHLVPDETHYRRRDGFKLTDNRKTPREITDQAHYCIFCHERMKDSCSRGFHEKDGNVKPNPLGIPLAEIGRASCRERV